MCEISGDTRGNTLEVSLDEVLKKRVLELSERNRVTVAFGAHCMDREFTCIVSGFSFLYAGFINKMTYMLECLLSPSLY